MTKKYSKLAKNDHKIAKIDQKLVKNAFQLTKKWVKKGSFNSKLHQEMCEENFSGPNHYSSGSPVKRVVCNLA